MEALIIVLVVILAMFGWGINAVIANRISELNPSTFERIAYLFAMPIPFMSIVVLIAEIFILTTIVLIKWLRS